MYIFTKYCFYVHVSPSTVKKIIQRVPLQVDKQMDREMDWWTDRQTDNTDKDSLLDNQKVSKGGQKSVHLSYLHVHVATMM